MRALSFTLFLFNLVTVALVHGQSAPVSKDSLAALVRSSEQSFTEYNYKDAIDRSALLISEATKAGDLYHAFLGYDLLGLVYLEIRDTLQAEVNYKKAYEIAIQTKSDSLLSWSYGNLGNIYSESDATFQKGIDYYKKSIAINDSIGDSKQNLSPYLNIGWTYIDQKKYDLALPFLLKAKSLIDEDPEDLLGQIEIKTLLGRYYIEKEKLTLAEEFLTEAREIAESQGYVVEGVEVYEHLTALYERQSNFEKAFESLKKAQVLNEQQYASEKVAETQIASARFNLEQYERDLESARMEQAYSDEIIHKSKQLQTILIIGFIVLLITLGLLYILLTARKKYIRNLRKKNRQLVLAKNRAEELSKLKTQFFSTVSHEIRTPLYGVIGIASILLEDKEVTTHRDDLQSLKFSADYLLALINDVLTLNKMEADGIVIEHNPFKLNRLLKSITKSFEFALEQNSNTLHLNIDKEIPNRLIGDSVRLSQILMNLIGNAIKFNENGNIWVTITYLGRKEHKVKAEFSIKDDGIGIPKDKHEVIFKEFSQVENNNYNYQGTGLGLPIVKKLLQLYNSDIRLESELDKGSTFSFVLDLEEDLTAKEDLEIDVIIDQDSTPGENHILVVDDNKINQKITQKILETRHFQCSLADDGAEAIALARNNHYDLILMDIHMPKVDGIDATKAIRKFNQEVPILALTAVEIAEIRKTILDAGMNDIVLKPYDVSQFITIILRNLHRKKVL